MTISLAGKLKPLPNSLSDLGRLALAFIDGGPEWFTWAANASHARYDFADETQLVSAVQHGLHASRYTLLPRLQLMVSPVKLMTLGLADLRVLAMAEGGDASEATAAQVRKVLSEHHLVTRSDLVAGMSFLAQLGLSGHALFQAMTFEEALAIHRLTKLPQATQSSALRQEAASFAALQARTVLEFCDYFRLYLDRATQLGAQAATPEQRDAAATQAMQALLPVLFAALDCPQTKGLAGPSAVAHTVGNWLTQGRQVGFARLSRGAQQIVQHTAYKGETGEAAKRLVDLYLHTAQSFLAAHHVERGLMQQDGATCIFPIEAGSMRAELQIGPSGVISLHDFGTKPAPVSLPAPQAVVQTPHQEIAS